MWWVYFLEQGSAVLVEAHLDVCFDIVYFDLNIVVFGFAQGEVAEEDLEGGRAEGSVLLLDDDDVEATALEILS